MDRIVHGDLFLNFTLDAVDTPTIINTTALILNYYRQSYEVVYGIGNYPSDDTDDDESDPKTIIQSNEFQGHVIAEISNKLQQWHDSGISSTGDVNPMPSFILSKNLQNILRRMSGKKNARLSSIRVYGNDYDDMGYL